MACTPAIGPFRDSFQPRWPLTFGRRFDPLAILWTPDRTRQRLDGPGWVGNDRTLSNRFRCAFGAGGSIFDP
jgi:hypothetical protein